MLSWRELLWSYCLFAAIKHRLRQKQSEKEREEKGQEVERKGRRERWKDD